MANPQQLLTQGMTWHQRGDLLKAEQFYSKVLSIQPKHPDALHLRGLILHQQGDHQQAIKLIGKAIKINSTLAEMHNNLGEAYRAIGKLTDAQSCYRKALNIRANFPEAINNLGLVLDNKGLAEQAIKNFKLAIKMKTNYVDARVNLAGSLKAQGDFSAALSCCDEVLAIQPDCLAGYSIKGLIHYDTGQLEQSIKFLKQALNISPNDAQINNNIGVALRDMGDLKEAIKYYLQAVNTNPNHAEALNNLGVALKELGQYQDASISFNKALAIKPSYPQAHFNQAGVLAKMGASAEAVKSYRQALLLKPDYQEARCELIHELRDNCDWAEVDKLTRQLIKSVTTSTDNVYPFTFLCLSTTAQQQLQCAKNWANKQEAQATKISATLNFKFDKKNKSILRIGYISADFHEHATAYLISELFELHDRKNVEIFGYSCGPQKQGEAHQRIATACDHFIDISDLPHVEAAKIIHQDGIDILVDLKGYTQGARAEILALRPAPIQVNYLGYPGTMGADFIDYLITDKVVVPTEDSNNFSEQLVYMPDCYQVNDRKRKISETLPTRVECGLADDVFVFCCLNTPYKITSEIFSVWMRVLLKVENSVLWLMASTVQGEKNLRKEAKDRGIDPERIIFAIKLPLDQHLARFKLGDLFLDTFPVTAHTTASDALWAGVPVLTCLGDSFVSRVAASILTTANFPELIEFSLQGYENRAIALANRKEELLQIRNRIENLKQVSPLFDTPAFTQTLEIGYAKIWQNFIKNTPPTLIDLSDI
ncbi:hypothetical protein A9Q98_08410 [Thalassotalea sp. 42_200_T64]|nr:hypothetical protein A9Q98_08410 [Thalassotalea sp. 42_200_T64]